MNTIAPRRTTWQPAPYGTVRSQMPQHRTPARRRAAARARFVRTWSQRWQRNAPAFVGGAATIMSFGLVAAIAAMLGTV